MKDVLETLAIVVFCVVWITVGINIDIGIWQSELPEWFKMVWFFG